MEKRISIIIDDYSSTMKANIRTFAIEHNITTDSKCNELLQYIFDYPALILEKEHFAKRKRAKNSVYFSDRCCAKRATGEQCTRRKKDNENYCGTHIKGTPHGIYNKGSDDNNVKSISVWVENIQGIYHYIDNNNNIYSSEDIIKGIENPRIISKYMIENNVYSILPNK